jgi:hypothetical protein
MRECPTMPTFASILMLNLIDGDNSDECVIHLLLFQQ